MGDTNLEETTLLQLDTAEKVFNFKPILGGACKVILQCEDNLSSPYPKNEEFTFTIGESDHYIGDAIEVALLTMQKGDTKTIQIMKEKDNSGDNCEENPLMADVTLIDINNKKPVYFWTAQEKYDMALHHKAKGVELFQQGLTDLAFGRFSMAVKYLILMQPRKSVPVELLDTYVQLRTQCYSNIAACQLKAGSYQYVVDNCTKALDLDPSNVKCLYRRAEAYFELKKLDQCKSDAKKGLTLEPNSKSFNSLLQKVDGEHEM